MDPVPDAPQQPDRPSLAERLRRITEDPSAPREHRRLASLLVVGLDACGEGFVRQLEGVDEVLRQLGVE